MSRNSKYSKYKASDFVARFLVGFLLGLFGLFAMTGLFVMTVIWGLSSLNIAENQDIRNAITYDYVVAQYPEFQNCSIKYTSDININSLIVEGAIVTCYGVDANRDSLEIIGQEKTPIKIAFKNGLTIDKLLEIKLRGKC